MSWSLQLRHGDLVTDGASLAQVTGWSKLTQDLRCAILERRGHDDMHPTFGSLIDGGYDDAGNWIQSLIGEDEIDFVVLSVETDLRRIMAEHQQRQVARAKDDRYVYGQSTLDPAEMLLEVNDIEFTQVGDELLVNVHIQNGTGNTYSISVPLQANSLG